MSIDIGEYGRTNKGKIFIFAWLENLDGKRDTNKVLLGNGKTFENKFYYFDDGEEIVKHSKQLINLIECGDIAEIRTGLYNSFMYSVENEDNLLLLKEQVKQFWNIKTILTKESYMANCYKVGGEDE